MANKLRSGLNSILVSALLGLLIASFAIWGVGGGMFISSNRVIATVGDTEIETADLVRTVQNQARQYQQQYGGAVSTQDIILGLQLHVQTLQQMISGGAMTDAATKLGLRGTNLQLSKEMLKVDAFQPIKKGTIDRETMLQTLNSAGFTYAKYERDTKRSIAQEQLINALTAATPVSRTLAEQLYTYRNESRAAHLLSLPGTLVKDIAAPQEGDLESFYQANLPSYMAPEYRSYNYVLLTPSSFEDQVEVNEDDLLQEYDYKKSEYSVPATRTLQQVSLESQEAAQSFIERIEAGEDFVKVAVELSDFTEEEITLPESDYDQVEADFSTEVANLVFALSQDEMSEAQEGFAGWSVFKLVSMTEGSSKSFDDVRDELQAAYVKDQAINLLYEFTDQVEEALSEGGNLGEISSQLNIPMASLSDIDAQGRGKDGSTGIATQAGGIILRAAYQSEIGDFLELKDVNADKDDRSMYLLELSDVIEAAQKPMESVLTELRVSWEAGRRQEEIGKLAEAAIERIKNGEDMDELAVEYDGIAYSAKNIQRTGTTESNISANLRRLLFSMAIGDADMEVSADGNGYIIAKLSSIKPGDAEVNAGQVDVILAQLETSMGNELLAQYQSQVGEGLEITVNEPLFQKTFNVPQQ